MGRSGDTIPEPAPFGSCGTCAYGRSGTPQICFQCAQRTIVELSKSICDICSHPLGRGDPCGNPLCGGARIRFFDKNYSIAARKGVLKDSLNAYKFDNRKDWAVIFSRILLGFLSSRFAEFRKFDLIVPAPTFLGPGGREWDHVRYILELADKTPSDRWPFDLSDPPAIIKTAVTSTMKDARDWKGRLAIAEDELREILAVPNPARTRKKRILVFDDIFTSGNTLNEIARCLREQGEATSVTGISLMRQVFGG